MNSKCDIETENSGSNVGYIQFSSQACLPRAVSRLDSGVARPGGVRRVRDASE